MKKTKKRLTPSKVRKEFINRMKQESAMRKELERWVDFLTLLIAIVAILSFLNVHVALESKSIEELVPVHGSKTYRLKHRHFEKVECFPDKILKDTYSMTYDLLPEQVFILEGEGVCVITKTQTRPVIRIGDGV